MVKKWSIKQKTILAVLLSVMAGVLSGCMGKDDADSGKEASGIVSGEGYELAEYIFVPEFYTPNENIDTITVFKDLLYYGTSEGEFYCWDIANGEAPEKLDWIELDSEVYYSGKLQPDFQGNFYLIYELERYRIDEKIPQEDYESPTFSFYDSYLAKYDADGNELYCERLIGALQNCIISDTAVDAEGHLFINGVEGVYTYDTDGTYHEIITPKARNSSIFTVTGNDDGQVYVNCYTVYENVIQEITYQNGILEEAYENIEFLNGFVPYKKEGFIGSRNGKLYCYDSNTQTNEELLKWMNCNIEQSQIAELGALSDGRIIAFLEDEDSNIEGEIALLSRKRRADIPQKELATIGTFCADDNLMRSVAQFNKYNEEYQIEVVEYYDSVLDTSTDGSGKKDAYTKLHLDIVTGKCPDILCLEYDEMQEYIGDGLFEDLTPYLKDSSLEIMENVIDAYTFDGELVALPVTLKIRTIAGASAAGIKSGGWTVQDMIAYKEEHEDKTMIHAGAQNMLEYCLYFNMSEFVDSRKGTCNFTNDEFYQILEFCKQYSNELQTSVYNIYTLEGKNELLYELELTQADDITLLNQVMHTSHINFVGFPSASGEGGHLLEANGGSYSISAMSDQKDAAWAFMEFMMKNVAKLSYYIRESGFPVDKSTCDKYFRIAMENPYDEYGERNFKHVLSTFQSQIYYYVPIESEVSVLRDLLESASFAKAVRSDFMDIIEEEAEEYFEGKKEKESVAEVIQSRVSIYLEEHK